MLYLSSLTSGSDHSWRRYSSGGSRCDRNSTTSSDFELVLLLFLRLASDLIGNLALLLLLVDGDAAFDVVLELPALARGQLVQLKFEHFTRIARQTLLHQVDYTPLLLLSQLTNVQLQLVLLLYVHGFVRVSCLLCEHDVILDLRLRPLILILAA